MAKEYMMLSLPGNCTTNVSGCVVGWKTQHDEFDSQQAWKMKIVKERMNLLCAKIEAKAPKSSNKLATAILYNEC